MARVHQVPKGTLGVPLPALAVGTIGRKVQGGLPPVPYRNACSRWDDFKAKWSREPFNSKSIKGEVWAERLSGW